ncbi:hypothetical protein [Halovulum sp. GXIMD14793]
MLTFLTFDVLMMLWPRAKSTTAKDKVLSVMLVKFYDDDFSSREERSACADWLYSHHSNWDHDMVSHNYVRRRVRSKLRKSHGKLRSA